MRVPRLFSSAYLRQLVEECLRRALPTAASLPGEGEDWVATGLLDSMAHVDVLLCIEKATGLRDFFNSIEGQPPTSMRAVIHALRGAVSERQQDEQGPAAASSRKSTLREATIAGWGFALGSQRIPANALEQEYALTDGLLRERAGIESVVRVAENENEVSLAERASQAALTKAETDAADVDSIIVTSETFLGFPSLGSRLHSRLLARDTCCVLDVGGACVGLLNCLAVAQSLLVSGVASRILVVTADVHSRLLAPGRVPGEFGGLFGDGASAFVLRHAEDQPNGSKLPYRLGEFEFGCAGTYASALVVGLGREREVTVKFDGEALGRAAVGRLEGIIKDLELRTGFSRHTVLSFATHQPNPRLLELLARQADLPLEKFPIVAKTCGNLGSSTGGVALAKALDEHTSKPPCPRGPIFLAAVGPGMLWGGAVLYAPA